MTKRRTRGPNQHLNTKLCVKHVPLAASDYKLQRKRGKELEPLQEEDEEEEEVEVKSEKSDNEKRDAEGEAEAAPDKDAQDELKSIVEEKSVKDSNPSSGGSDSEKLVTGNARFYCTYHTILAMSKSNLPSNLIKILTVESRPQTAVKRVVSDESDKEHGSSGSAKGSGRSSPKRSDGGSRSGRSGSDAGSGSGSSG